tara:strand:- start:289 stop:513 length:225 start_codon:yes stop_codon:yes gene_type:complete
MTAKEKALELIQRFSKLDKGLNEEEWKDREVSFEEIHKKFALICVDEVLEELGEELELAYNYWTEVKQEINNKI